VNPEQAPNPAQAFSVKRAQVEFHNFASFGEPERALRVYAEENGRRGSILRRHLEFVGVQTPFLEIGSNIGHSSYMMANEFGADGFALDISADSLRFGPTLQEAWGMPRAPVRVAGDAVNLPFKDGSLRMVLAFQMLSQFLDIEQVFREVKRVLAPGGVFYFSEEPLRRSLSLRLYRCPYYETMKPWERRLHDWGLLGYLVQDVIGAHQEESFGIRQNHQMYLDDWDQLIRKHFVARELEMFVPERGWGERIVKQAAVFSDPERSQWTGARWLGGTLSAFCRKEGQAPAEFPSIDQFEAYLRCPDCHGDLLRDAVTEDLRCARCTYSAPNQGGVYNLLPSAERSELYPGDREDIIDFSLPEHTVKLGDGWYGLEGVYGNKFRWIGAHASAVLKKVTPGGAKIRIRGHAPEHAMTHSNGMKIAVLANGNRVGEWTLDRPGLFIVEGSLPDGAEYRVDIEVSPVWRAPGDARDLTVNLSMIRLIPDE
jgi:ubiquinone/menaquinone biosynthesis C-methylase UbiE